MRKSSIFDFGGRLRRFLAFTSNGKRDFTDFHPEAAGEDAEPAPLVQLLIFTIALFLVTALLWSSLGTVEQVANASSIVRPSGGSRSSTTRKAAK